MVGYLFIGLCAGLFAGIVLMGLISANNRTDDKIFRLRELMSIALSKYMKQYYSTHVTQNDIAIGKEFDAAMTEIIWKEE